MSAFDPNQPPAIGPEWRTNGRASDIPIEPGGEPSPFADLSDVPPVNGSGPNRLDSAVFDEPTAAPLAPNRADISRHLYALFPPDFVKAYPDDWVEIAYADLGGDGKPSAARHFSPFDLQKAIDFAEAKNRAGFNIYVGPALRHGKTGDNSKGRSSGANFLASLYGWSDFDEAGDYGRINDALKARGLRTSMLVMTGRTPHERGHPYFKLADKATKDQVRDVNIALKTLLGTDDVEDVCRVMRLAGTVSFPPSDKVARGYIPELVTLHIRKDAPAYTVEQLTGLTGIASASRSKTSNPSLLDFNNTTKPGRTDDEIINLLEASRAPTKWHNNVRDAIATMIGRGWSDSAIRLACKPYCRDGYGDADLDDFINRGRAKWDKPDDIGPRAEQAPPPPLQWLDMSKWDDEPVPERQWAIRDRVPLNQVGLFSGEGGTGKSIIEIMKDVAHVTGADWLGSLPEPGPAFYLGAEDDKDEIHIRLAAIARHYGVTFKDLTKGGLCVLPLLGQDAVLCAANGKSGRVETTTLYRQIYEAAGDLKPRNISVDTLSRAFFGNEIDRAQVYAFAMHMQALAMVASGSVTILSHPSLAGMASGSGISGSTAWHGAFRFRQYLKGAKADEGDQPDNDLREIEFKKNQYGPLGQSIVLRYDNGLFLPVAGVSGLDRIAREAKADGMFLDLLRRFAGQGQNVSHKKNAPNYAPTAFAQEPEANGPKFRRSEFEEAMRRLFATNKIHAETYGRPSHPASKLVVKTTIKERPNEHY